MTYIKAIGEEPVALVFLAVVQVAIQKLLTAMDP